MIRTAQPTQPGAARPPLAMVVGGSRGLGLLIARELGREGYRPAICARDGDELAQAVRILRSQDVDAVSEVCDVADPAAVSDWVEYLEREVGPVDAG